MFAEFLVAAHFLVVRLHERAQFLKPLAVPRTYASLKFGVRLRAATPKTEVLKVVYSGSVNDSVVHAARKSVYEGARRNSGVLREAAVLDLVNDACFRVLAAHGLHSLEHLAPLDSNLCLQLDIAEERIGAHPAIRLLLHLVEHFPVQVVSKPEKIRSRRPYTRSISERHDSHR